MRPAWRGMRRLSIMARKSPENPIIAVIGATGTGKSQVCGFRTLKPNDSVLTTAVS
jgi:hypothetical protein